MVIKEEIVGGLPPFFVDLLWILHNIAYICSMQ